MTSARKTHRANARWTNEEENLLREHYSSLGANIPELAQHRSQGAIHMKAHKLGLERIGASQGRQMKLTGEALEEAIKLRQHEGWSYAKIGKHFGITETSASNAILIALCARNGHTPAQRHPNGRLTDEGIARLRYALRKGLKGVEITLRLGVSAACVAEQRKRYSKELKASRKAPLPLHGNDQHYSGRKLSKAEKSQVEQLFQKGYGAPKISAITGISKTSCQRIRAKLIARLARKKQTLTGCTRKGKRTDVLHSTAMIPQHSKEMLRAMLLDRLPVSRAAAICGVGASSAYKIRDQLALELQSNGDDLKRPVFPGRTRSNASQSQYWPPSGRKEFIAFRTLLETKTFDDAKACFIDTKQSKRKAEHASPRSFDETLRLVGEGKLRLTQNFSRCHLEPMISKSVNQHDARPQPAHI
jgi:hypothetical protein